MNSTRRLWRWLGLICQAAQRVGALAGAAAARS